MLRVGPRLAMRGDPDSIMDVLPLNTQTEDALFDDAWRTPAVANYSNPLLNGSLHHRSALFHDDLELQYEHDLAILDALMGLNINTLRLAANWSLRGTPRQPPLPRNRKRAAKRARRAEHKARTQERRASQRSMR